MTDSSDIAAKAREALDDPNNLDLALNPEPLVRYLLAALETAETEQAKAKAEAAEMLQSRAELADEAQGLRNWRDGERRQNERAAAISAVTPCSCSAQRTRAEGAETKVRAVELALSNHPECDTYSPDDVVSCGWKRAVVDVRAALGGVS